MICSIDLRVLNVTLVEGMCVSAKAHVHEIAGMG